MGSDKVFDSDGDIIDYQVAIVEYANGVGMNFHTNLNVPDQFRRFGIIGTRGHGRGRFHPRLFRRQRHADRQEVVEKKYAATELSQHYGADEQMAADIIAHVSDGGPLPVSTLDALEAGILALAMDEARRKRQVVDLRPIWDRFDGALAREGGLRMAKERSTQHLSSPGPSSRRPSSTSWSSSPIRWSTPSSCRFTDASLSKTTNWVGWVNYEKIFNADLRRGHRPHLRLDLLLGQPQDDHRHLRRRAAQRRRARPALFRILTMPPWIVPMAIGIFMWGWMYNGQFGMISGLLQRFGIVDGPVAFLAYGNTAFWATIITDVWIGVPLVTLYLLAAMQAIPQDLYEAAWTDGAGRFYRFRRITLPLMVPAMITMSMLSLIATFNSFDIIWILTQGGPNGATTTMIIDTYQTAIGSKKYGEGAARAVLICIFLPLLPRLFPRHPPPAAGGRK